MIAANAHVGSPRGKTKNIRNELDDLCDAAAGDDALRRTATLSRRI
jgi:hypothetical protein